MKYLIIVALILLSACSRVSVEEYKIAVVQCESIGMHAYKIDIGGVCCKTRSTETCQAWPTIKK